MDDFPSNQFAPAFMCVSLYSNPMPVARQYIFLSAVLALIAAAFVLPPIAEPTGYLEFADRRTGLGISNAADVLSNLPFLILGAWGMIQSLRSHPAWKLTDPIEIHSLRIFFAGIFATAIGSAYFHLDPSSDRLFWDRLPMTLAFMSLFASLVGERIVLSSGPKMGARLLVPLLVAGASSVLYWRQTELEGAGDLRFYALVQFGPILLFPLLCSLFKPRYTRAWDLAWVFGFYALAKLLEVLDRPIFDFTQLISGHTLKHLAAAGAIGMFLRHLVLRAPRQT